MLAQKKRGVSRRAKRLKAKNKVKDVKIDVSQYVPISSLVQDDVELELEIPDDIATEIYNNMDWPIPEEEDNSDEVKFREKLFGSGDQSMKHPEDDSTREIPLTNKQKRLLNRPTMCLLKTVAVRPDIVESWDTTAKEPGILIALKSWYNVVSIPGHWNSKRRYLAGKRALDRGPFQLPEHIQQTKITEIRSALVAREEEQTLRQKLRSRARPKGQRMDLDYQTLHDAFFKYAKKPALTGFGQLYYEGKEQEMKFSKFIPGMMSDTLKEALGLILPLAPPPWLYNMQRYGPPPAYPGLRVPGVNCAIPAGAEYGFASMRWGALPSDSLGNPAWGDLGPAPENVAWDNGEWTEFLWGEMEEEHDMDIADMESDEEEAADTSTIMAPAIDSDKHSEFSGVDSTSVGHTSGVETPSSIDLRQGIESAQGGSLGLQPYKVLQPQAVDLTTQRNQLFVSSTLYDVRESLKEATDTAQVIAKKDELNQAKMNSKKIKSSLPKGFKF